MSKIHIIRHYANHPYQGIEVNTTYNSPGLWSGLSPFILGPINLPDLPEIVRFENLWQFSKVYSEYADSLGEPLPEFFTWRKEGFLDYRAHRYPMGRGRKPLYSYWYGKHLSYIEARKTIYAPIYAEYVQKTQAFNKLKDWYKSGQTLILRDWDAYDHIALKISLKDVINNPNRIMGHAFVLAMVIQNELEECLK